MLFGLFDKNMTLPLEFGEFPLYDEKVKKGPLVKETPSYKRITYYVKKVDAYKQKLITMGFQQKSEVRFDRGDKRNYIIIEPSGWRYKIAYHKAK